MGIERVATSVDRTPSRAERLSWQEICVRYPDAWVVLVGIEYDNPEARHPDKLSAVVIAHSKTRSACMVEARRIMDLQEIRHCGRFYTGEIRLPPVSLRFS